MKITTVRTGTTLVSSAVPDRSTHAWKYAYTRLFQTKKSRIEVPVKCYYVEVNGHSFLIDAGWSVLVAKDPKKHLGFALLFASEPVMKEEEAAVNVLKGKKIDGIFMTHFDCDHISGCHDFKNASIYAAKEEIEYSAKNKTRYGKLTRGLNIRPLEFSEDMAAPFGKSRDIFEDGSVRAYLTPTHSKGSIVYKVADKDGFALIVGDNGYTEDAWEKEILPGPIYDIENMKKCLRWIYEESKREDCKGVYCAHSI